MDRRRRTHEAGLYEGDVGLQISRFGLANIALIFHFGERTHENFGLVGEYEGLVGENFGEVGLNATC